MTLDRKKMKRGVSLLTEAHKVVHIIYNHMNEMDVTTNSAVQ